MILTFVVLCWIIVGLILAWLSGEVAEDPPHIATDIIVIVAWPVLLITLLIRRGERHGNDR